MHPHHTIKPESNSMVVWKAAWHTRHCGMLQNRTPKTMHLQKLVSLLSTVWTGSSNQTWIRINSKTPVWHGLYTNTYLQKEAYKLNYVPNFRQWMQTNSTITYMPTPLPDPKQILVSPVFFVLYQNFKTYEHPPPQKKNQFLQLLAGIS